MGGAVALVALTDVAVGYRVIRSGFLTQKIASGGDILSFYYACPQNAFCDGNGTIAVGGVY